MCKVIQRTICFVQFKNRWFYHTEIGFSRPKLYVECYKVI